MAIIPQIEPGQIRRRLPPAVRLGAEAFGGVEAQELRQAGESLEQIANIAGRLTLANQQKVNNSKSESVFHGYTNAMNAWVETDLKLRRGEDAEVSYGLAKGKIGELRKSFTKDLDNDRQVELFNAAADRSEVGYLNMALTHQQREIRRAEDTVSRQSISQAWENAVVARDNPVLLGVALVNGEAKIEEKIPALEEYKGMPKEVVQAAVDEAKFAMYDGVRKALLVESPGAALTFFNLYKEKFEAFGPLVVPGVEEATRQKAESEAIIGMVNQISNSGLSLEEQYDRVAVLAEGLSEAGVPISKKGMDEINSRLRNEFSKQQTLKKLEADKVVRGIYDEYFAAVKAGQGDDFQVPYTAPRAVVNHIAELKKKALEKDAFLAGGRAKPGAVTNHNSKNKLMSMPLSELNALDKTKDKDWKKLDASDWEEVFNHSKGGTKFLRVQTWNAQVKGIMDRTDLLTTGVRPGIARNLSQEGVETARAQFSELIAKEVQDLPEKERTPINIRKIAAEMLEDVSIKVPVNEDLPVDPLGGLASPEGYIIHQWRRRSKTLRVKRFEVQFLPETAQEVHAKGMLSKAPESIRGIPGLQWHEATRTYFAPVLGEIRVYTEDTGDWFDTYEELPNPSGER